MGIFICNQVIIVKNIRIVAFRHRLSKVLPIFNLEFI